MSFTGGPASHSSITDVSCRVEADMRWGNLCGMLLHMATGIHHWLPRGDGAALWISKNCSLVKRQNTRRPSLLRNV